MAAAGYNELGIGAVGQSLLQQCFVVKAIADALLQHVHCITIKHFLVLTIFRSPGYGKKRGTLVL